MACPSRVKIFRNSVSVFVSGRAKKDDTVYVKGRLICVFMCLYVDCPVQQCTCGHQTEFALSLSIRSQAGSNRPFSHQTSRLAGAGEAQV